MFIYITTQELTHLFILTQEELFSKIREKSEYSTPLYANQPTTNKPTDKPKLNTTSGPLDLP
jgi:hypothetical protein